MIPFTEVCIIHGMVVDPDYQQQGIGNKLLNVVLEYCHVEGINTIRPSLRKVTMSYGVS